MPAVKNHPRVELSGTAPNISLVLTDPEGNSIMESTGVFATAALAQAGAKALEDSVLYALPIPAPLG